MWIIPKSLTSTFALDTEVLAWGSSESFQACAQSLTRRSKNFPAVSWQRAWKRGNLTLPLYGLICEPSLGNIFSEKWTSCPAVFHARVLALPGNGSQIKTLGIFSLTSNEESSRCSHNSCSSKMLKESSPQNSPEKDGTTPPEHLFCSMSLENWKEWVTAQRGEYSVRVKSARLTSASASLYSAWQTATVSTGAHRQSDGSMTDKLDQQVKNWPTTTTTTRDHKDGTAESCKNVPVNGLLGRFVHLHSGRPDLESRNTDGSLQELWPTPEGMGGGKTSRGGDRKDELLLGGMVKEQWRTPSDPTKRGGSQPAEKRAEGGHTINLEDQLHTQGKLNPAWVCLLMNLPVHWVRPA